MTPSMPPRLLRRLISLSLGDDAGTSLLHDLDGLYAGRAESQGRAFANAWYARQTFGFLSRVGSSRIADAIGGSDSLLTDAGYALRSFRHRPAFSIAFILTLAVGTGVVGTVYSAARWVLLRPVPGVSGANELMTLRLSMTGAPPFVAFEVSNPDLVVLRGRLPVNGALAGASPVEVDLRPATGEPRRVAGEVVSANYFSVLRAQMTAGRAFLPADDSPLAGAPSVVLSTDLARSLNAEPAERLVGTDVRMNGSPVRVVGIAGPGFHGSELPGQAQFWVPLSATMVVDPSVSPKSAARRDFGSWRRMIARTETAIAPSVLESRANAVIAQTRTEQRLHSYQPLAMAYRATPGIGLDPGVKASVTRTLTLLTSAALLLLTLAIANLMNLGLVQSTLRQSTTAIRFALGASRMRVARSLIVETILLGGTGAGVALLLAWAWTWWFQGTRLNERGAALEGMHVDAPVIIVTFAAALLASLIAFLAPARMIRLPSLGRLMGRSTDAGPTAHRIRSALAAVQVALSVVLLVTAMLMGRTVANLRNLGLGFEPDRLLTYSLDPHLHGYESASLDRLARNLEAQLGQDASVAGAGFISPTPLSSSYVTASLYPSDAESAKPVVVAGYYVSPGFLSALGARVIAGDPHWRADSGSAVISRAMLEQLLPGTAPEAVIGRLFPTRGRRNPVRIAAVIDDIRLSAITGKPTPILLRPLSERLAGLSMMGVARSARPARMAPLVARTLKAHAPDLPVFNVKTAREVVDIQFAERDAMARAASTLGVIGLLLAAIGLYGVLSNVVAARRREIGIRAALGASPRRIVMTIARNGLTPVAFGAVAGVTIAAGLSKLLNAQLYELSRFDPFSYAMSVGALLTCAVIACLIPAYRATRVSPVDVLRAD